jgi:hypothetical protein
MPLIRMIMRMRRIMLVRRRKRRRGIKIQITLNNIKKRILHPLMILVEYSTNPCTKQIQNP